MIMVKTEPDPHLDQCFFLLGCDRSGTTLLRSMLNGHPDLMISYEAPASVSLQETFQRRGYRATVEALRGKFPQFELVDWVRVLDQVIDLPDPALSDLMALVYRDLLRQTNKRLWGDKTPAYTRFVRQLAEMYPNSKFVHIVRDPRAVAVSWMKTNWGPNTALHAGQEWTQRVSEALESLGQLPQHRWVHLRFEDLVRDPMQTLSSVCATLGVDPDPGMIKDRDDDKDRLPNAYFQRLHARSQRPVDPSRIERWKALGASQVRRIEASTWDLMQDLGYEPCGSSTPGVAGWEVVQSKLHNRWRRWVNHVRRGGDCPAYPLPSGG